MTRSIIPGALYNIIKVPPQKKDATDTLQEAKILSSIVPEDKGHPSYYHSFGKSALSAMSVSFTLPPSATKPRSTFLYFQPCLRTTWCSSSSQLR